MVQKAIENAVQKSEPEEPEEPEGPEAGRRLKSISWYFVRNTFFVIFSQKDLDRFLIFKNFKFFVIKNLLAIL